MDKDLPKIETKTTETWRNKKTGKVYNSKEELEMDPSVDPKDLQKDLTVTISPKGLNVLQKLMKQK